MEHHIPKKGECYRHFKGNRYTVLAVAAHTETSEQLVVYEGLYGEHPVFARPLWMFLEKVDREKYPDALQEYRFELQEKQDMPGAGKADMIMEFLDLDTNEEKMRFLQQRRPDITDSFLSSAAMSMDFAESQTDMDLRYTDLMHYLDTLIKYEGRRR